MCIFVFNPGLTLTLTTAERRAKKQCRRRGASSGQKTKRGIEGVDPAAAGIERFFSLKGVLVHSQIDPLVDLESVRLYDVWMGAKLLNGTTIRVHIRI